MFHISTEELEDLKKRRNERYMYSVLRQAAQLKQPQSQEFKAPKSKPASYFHGSSSPSSNAKPKPRTAETPSSQQPQASSQSSIDSSLELHPKFFLPPEYGADSLGFKKLGRRWDWISG